MSNIKMPPFVSTRNACKLCAPLGASLVIRGIENCIPLVHGSQGCSTYIRRYCISHFREPMDIASSNFVETTAIFGGRDNLYKAIDNVTTQYQPSAIGITSTCLSETMGEDVESYLREYIKHSPLHKKGKLPILFYASTPSYRGTHMDGFHEAVYEAIKQFTKNDSGVTQNRINVISSFLSTSDIRELHSILQSFGHPYTLFPDYSETLDGGAWKDYHKIPPGGTKTTDIAAMRNGALTLQLGTTHPNRERYGAVYLRDNFGVPAHFLELPIGLKNTDRFFQILMEYTEQTYLPYWQAERMRLIDAYADGHKYCFNKRAIVYGEEDFVIALTSFLDEIGVIPVLVSTGAPGHTFENRVKTAAKNLSARNAFPDIHVMPDTDFATMYEHAVDLQADFIIGNSKGLFLSRELGIPLIRCGFPIHDRIGGHRILHIGYRGTLNLFERICNTLIETEQNKVEHGWTYV